MRDDDVTKQPFPVLDVNNLNRCPIATNIRSHKSLVRPKVEYAASVWDPYTQLEVKKIETVQRKAARFVMADFR